MNYISIEPVDITKTIKSFKIDVPYIILNTKCFVRVLCFDSENKLINTYEFELEKPDYNSWLSDDDLIDYVCNKYGFTLINN